MSTWATASSLLNLGTILCHASLQLQSTSLPPSFVRGRTTSSVTTESAKFVSDACIGSPKLRYGGQSTVHRTCSPPAASATRRTSLNGQILSYFISCTIRLAHEAIALSHSLESRTPSRGDALASVTYPHPWSREHQAFSIGWSFFWRPFFCWCPPVFGGWLVSA